MRKFTKFLEEIENTGVYKVNATVELMIEAENEGEAGYLADSILSSIDNCGHYTMLDIEKSYISENSTK